MRPNLILYDMNEQIKQIAERLRGLRDVLDLSPEEVAERIGISYSLFRRIFREAMGTSPAQYQMEIRLRKAQELLTTTSHSIAKIGDMLGFSDTAQFSTFFRKRQNMTPREYRNKHK